MDCQIYLVRHGIPELPYEGHRFLGTTDYPLSGEGKAALAETRGFFAGKKISRVYASPLIRAIETAREVFGAERSIEIVPELIEIEMGAWEGMAIEELQEQCPGEYEARCLDMEGYVPPGGESFGALLARAMPALVEIARGKGPAAVFGHSCVIRCVIGALTGVSMNDLFSIDVPYGSVTQIGLEDGLLRIM